MPGATTTAALLRPEEFRQYTYALQARDEQQNRIAAARSALEREEFLGAAIDDRCESLWKGICDAHGLDADADYKVDGSGLAYISAIPTQEDLP